jgi:WD40 repeat protein
MRLFQGQRQPVEALDFSGDGRHLAATDGAGVSVYDVQGGRSIRRIGNSHGRPHLMAFLPNGRLVVVAGKSMRVHVRPTVNGGFVGFFPNEVEMKPHSLFALPDGSRLFAVTRQVLHCWTMTEHVPQGAWKAEVGDRNPTIAAALSADGEHVAIYHKGHGLVCYSTRDGEITPGQFSKLFGAERLVWSPDRRQMAGIVGERFVVMDRDGDVYYVRPESRHHFTSLVFHPSGRWVLVGCGDGAVRLYDPASGGVVKAFAWAIGKVRSVAVSADGMLAAAGGDKGQVVVWDVDE